MATDAPKAIDSPIQSFTPVTFGLIVLWLSLNCSLTLFNKWLFANANFQLPILITLSHMSVGVICGSFGVFTRASTAKRAWKSLLLLSVFFCCSVALGNVSLLYIHVTTFQIIKSLTPVFQVFVSRFLEGKRYPREILFCIPVIVAGAVLAMFKPPDFHVMGYMFGIGSAIACALQNSFSAILLQNLKVDVFTTWLFQSIGSFILLFPCFMYFEYNEAVEIFKSQPNILFLYISIGMALAFFYNIVHYAFVRNTSALYSALAGLFKVAFLIVVSMIFWKFKLDFIHWLGIVLVLMGFFSFNWITYKLKQRALSQQYTSVSTNDKDKFLNQERASRASVSSVESEDQHAPLMGNVSKRTARSTV